MGGGGDTKTESNTVSQPWAGQQPYLSDLYRRAQAARDQPRQYYPYETYVPRNATQQQAGGMTRELAGADSPFVQGVGGMAQKTFAGDYLSPDSNPWLKQTFDRAATDVGQAFNRTIMPSIGARYSSAGQAGSPQEAAAIARAQGELSDSLSGMATDIYGGNYSNERNRQIQMSQMAPALEESRFFAPQQLENQGTREQADQQNLLDSWIDRYEYNRDEVDMRNARYSGMLGNVVPGGGYSEQRAKPGGSQLTQALQAAAAMASMFTPTPGKR